MVTLDVTLQKSISKEKSGVEYWNIFANGKRAGKAFIEIVSDKTLGKCPMIQIFLNKQSQGKGIGSIAYKKACKLSQYKTIYAEMRKSNIASIKAAKHAGFVEKVIPGKKQVVMVWDR